jgi:large subunit ribosomal protein L1
MAKKSELLEQAKELNLKVTEKNTIAEIQAAIDGANNTEAKAEEPKLAKAGKHSAKGLKEAEEKQAKIERQHKAEEDTEGDEDAPKPAKKPVKPTRTRLERRGKNYKKASELIEKGKEYTFTEAIELALKTNPSKFDASVELHVKLGVDPRQADQNIRGTVSLPAGTGKDVKVAVFGDVDDVKAAKTAGADIAGSEEFLQQLDKEQLDFDVLISTPQMMAKLGKYARLLGPKGLMPNPKSGTVTKDVANAVKEAKAGKVEYRVDSTGIIHLSVGKTNFKPEGLEQNLKAVVSAIKAAKPASIKSTYVQSVFVTTTMGPSIRVASSEV